MNIQKQSGAALIVGLVLLVVITLVALSALKTTTIQQRLAGNFQQRTTVYQATESAIRQLVVEAESPAAAGAQHILVQSLNAGVDAPMANRPQRDFDAERGVNSSADIVYDGEFPAAGFSLGAGAGSFVGHNYTIQGQSRMVIDQVNAQHLQGIERIGPSS